MGHRALREGPPLKIKIDGSPGFAWNPAPTLILRFSLNLRIAKFYAILLTNTSGTQHLAMSLNCFAFVRDLRLDRLSRGFETIS
jgi:hypothetical protein